MFAWPGAMPRNKSPEHVELSNPPMNCQWWPPGSSAVLILPAMLQKGASEDLVKPKDQWSCCTSPGSHWSNILLVLIKLDYCWLWSGDPNSVPSCCIVLGDSMYGICRVVTGCTKTFPFWCLFNAYISRNLQRFFKNGPWVNWMTTVVDAISQSLSRSCWYFGSY